MAKCLQCNKDISQIEGKKQRLYCSDACRKAYSRANTDKIEQSKADKSNTDNPVSNTDIKSGHLTENEKLGITERGKCHGCGKEVKHYICICQECFRKGITHKSLGLDIAKCD